MTRSLVPAAPRPACSSPLRWRRACPRRLRRRARPRPVAVRLAAADAAAARARRRLAAGRVRTRSSAPSRVRRRCRAASTASPATSAGVYDSADHGDAGGGRARDRRRRDAVGRRVLGLAARVGHRRGDARAPRSRSTCCRGSASTSAPSTCGSSAASAAHVHQVLIENIRDVHVEQTEVGGLSAAPRPRQRHRAPQAAHADRYVAALPKTGAYSSRADVERGGHDRARWRRCVPKQRCDAGDADRDLKRALKRLRRDAAMRAA